MAGIVARAGRTSQYKVRKPLAVRIYLRGAAHAPADDAGVAFALGTRHATALEPAERPIHPRPVAVDNAGERVAQQ